MSNDDEDPGVCPVHQQTDCSPLLNGCTRLTDPQAYTLRRYETAARRIVADAPEMSEVDVDEAVDSLVAEGLAEVRVVDGERQFKLTAKGLAGAEEIVGRLLS
jgi:hypothetical protein